MQNQEKFLKYRALYPTFLYESYQIEEKEMEYLITYHFSIPNLTTFHPTFSFSKKIVSNWDRSYVDLFIFHLGLIELMSYIKCTCSKNIIIKAGYLDEVQKKWFLNLYYHGLGEFLYTNGISISKEDLFHIETLGSKIEQKSISYIGSGNLIPVGGGKDSIVTLELLKGQENTCFILNPKAVQLDCVQIAGYQDQTMIVRRQLDEQLQKLNQEGFLNGHTPFSALLAFMTYFIAYLSGKRYIVLSNEGSANEATVIGTDINHQYSKSYQFETDFQYYMDTYFKLPILYFSFLRPLSEYQIGMLFSKMNSYHSLFHSCNIGSKKSPWEWCCHCSKCLFVYIILNPFLSEAQLISIFGKDLFQDKSLLPIFLELIGEKETKPFDCVGTIREVRYAIEKTIRKRKQLPYLLQYYKDHNKDLVLDDLEHEYYEEHHLPKEFDEILRKKLEVYDREHSSDSSK